MNNSNETIGNRPRDLPACSAVPPTTAPPRALILHECKFNCLSWQGFQSYALVAFIPRKYSWYSFLLESESTPGP